jgi:hypothetical protein
MKSTWTVRETFPCDTAWVLPALCQTVTRSHSAPFSASKTVFGNGSAVGCSCGWQKPDDKTEILLSQATLVVQCWSGRQQRSCTRIPLPS